MEPLFKFAHDNPNLSATEALRQYVTSQSNPAQQNQINFAQNALMHQGAGGLPPNLQPPPGQRTPSFPGAAQNQFASPTHPPHLNLPMNHPGTASASPATLNNMSPAMQNHVLQQGTPQQQHQPAPTSAGMMPQPGLQGTNNGASTGSQGTSANTSPNATNATNKRRRASQIKTEGDNPGNPGGAVEVNGTGPGAGSGGGAKVKASPRPGGKRQKGTV